MAEARDTHDAPGSPAREAGNKIDSMHFLGLFAINSMGKLTIKLFREFVLILFYIQNIFSHKIPMRNHETKYLYWIQMKY